MFPWRRSMAIQCEPGLEQLSRLQMKSWCVSSGLLVLRRMKSSLGKTPLNSLLVVGSSLMASAIWLVSIIFWVVFLVFFRCRI